MTIVIEAPGCTRDRCRSSRSASSRALTVAAAATYGPTNGPPLAGRRGAGRLHRGVAVIGDRSRQVEPAVAGLVAGPDGRGGSGQAPDDDAVGGAGIDARAAGRPRRRPRPRRPTCRSRSSCRRPPAGCRCRCRVRRGTCRRRSSIDGLSSSERFVFETPMTPASPAGIGRGRRAVVAGRRDDDDVVVPRVVDGGLEGGAEARVAERQVDDVGAVIDGPDDAFDDVAVLAEAVRVEHGHRHDLDAGVADARDARRRCPSGRR